VVRLHRKIEGTLCGAVVRGCYVPVSDSSALSSNGSHFAIGRGCGSIYVFSMSEHDHGLITTYPVIDVGCKPRRNPFEQGDRRVIAVYDCGSDTWRVLRWFLDGSAPVNLTGGRYTDPVDWIVYGVDGNPRVARLHAGARSPRLRGRSEPLWSGQH
jgi:hypothetical protein